MTSRSSAPESSSDESGSESSAGHRTRAQLGAAGDRQTLALLGVGVGDADELITTACPSGDVVLPGVGVDDVVELSSSLTHIGEG